MKLEFYKSSSSVKPELIDATSSKKVVYIRQNIVEVQKDDAVFYEYDEAIKSGNLTDQMAVELLLTT